MGKRLVVAADVRDWKGCGETRIPLPHDAIVTPEAVDLAKELGIALVRDGDSSQLPKPPSLDGRPASARGAKVKLIRGAQIQPAPFGFDVKRPDMHIRATDIVTDGDASPMGAGIMAFDQGSFPWTLNYDEIDYVIEGELEIRAGEESFHGQPGDIIYIPRGTSILFCTPTRTRFLYVTFPANWTSK